MAFPSIPLTSFLFNIIQYTESPISFRCPKNHFLGGTGVGQAIFPPGQRGPKDEKKQKYKKPRPCPTWQMV
jgi:hypothetical protein